MRGRLVGTGATANVYEWGEPEVIKIFHDSSRAQQEAEKEARVARAISGLSGVKAPKFIRIEQYEGSACLVYEKADGPTMLGHIQATEESVIANARLLAELQHELHQIRPDVTPNLKLELGRSIQRVGELSDEEQAKLASLLEQLPDGGALCHYDFHPGNIILTTDGPQIIDWMNALVGHPAADVARTYLLLTGSELPPDMPEELRFRIVGYQKQFTQVYIDAILELSGLSMADVEAWLAPTLAVRISELSEGKEREKKLVELRGL
ncbi:phosphotransferase family protein [Paenibacillus sp. OV219]|uniref:phosphotransferase family protein n=1 Tax=Paenibacillus sp. OV219 TaxID=1884377 RepID=UPI0008AC273D|nr:aminoglycoside phosphotransferase family protein [Paenibacillus sp. OV219]SEO13647.1 Phosphotransferase enzyme family protein [Paenibacillus sp. OV219]